MSRTSKAAQRTVQRILWRVIGFGAIALLFALCIGCMVALNLSDIRALLGL